MKLKCYYYNREQNAGDIFTVWILRKLGFDTELSTTPDIAVTGSIMDDCSIFNSKIWGIGFHNENDTTKVKLENVYAVRGKLSAKKLGYNGVTGDPGILASKFYQPRSIKKYKFGIVPHYVDYNWFSALHLSDIKVINIQTDNFEFLFDEINECEFILSSSLHGIIFSHSFGIPAIRIKHNEIASKNGFKFKDYYSNFGIEYLEKKVMCPEQLYADMDLLFDNRDMFLPPLYKVEQNQNELLFSFNELIKSINHNIDSN